MSDPVIRFDQVGKSYPQYHHITGGFKTFLFNLPKALRQFRASRFEALRNITFQVPKGQALGFVGRNGAGKSTTLGLMAGVLKPTMGRVEVRGRVAPLLELGAGFNADLTGRENILLNSILMGMTRKEAVRKADEIIAFAELGEFIDQPIRVYSSGMVARLGFSVVSSVDPDILLVDEVLAVGDLNFQKKCMDRMHTFKRKGVTIVLVSHSLSNFEGLCDRVIWIEDHTLKMDGLTPDVIAAYSAA